MRTVPFQSILFGVAAMLGLDIARDLTPSRAAMLTEYINTRCKEGWEYDWWPEWRRCERRSYRAPWNATTAYVAGAQLLWHGPTFPYYVQALQASTGVPPSDAQNNVNQAYWAELQNDYTGPLWVANVEQNLGDQVLNPNDGRYYQCIVAGNTGGVFNDAMYGALAPFDKVVGYEQGWAASVGEPLASGRALPLGRVKQVSVRNPLVATRNPGYIPFEMSDRGCQVNIAAPPLVWVTFGLREPRFTTLPWRRDAQYLGEGELVYCGSPPDRAPEGECYRSVAASKGLEPKGHAEAWERQRFPLALAKWTKMAAQGDALGDLKQTDRAKIVVQDAYVELADAVDRVIQAQGGSEAALVETYGSGACGENFFAS